jgi:hypothetical protein
VPPDATVKLIHKKGCRRAFASFSSHAHHSTTATNVAGLNGKVCSLQQQQERIFSTFEYNNIFNKKKLQKRNDFATLRSEYATLASTTFAHDDEHFLG